MGILNNRATRHTPPLAQPSTASQNDATTSMERLNAVPPLSGQDENNSAQLSTGGVADRPCPPLRVGMLDDTPRLSAPVQPLSPITGSAHSQDDADTGSLAYTGRSYAGRELDVVQTSERATRDSGRAFLEERELGFLRPSTASPSRPGDDSAAMSGRMQSVDTSENTNSPRKASLAHVLFLVYAQAFSVLSLAWDAVVPVVLDDERKRDYLTITLSRRLRSARSATLALAVGAVSYAVACLVVTPISTLLACALTSLAVVVFFFLAYSSMRSATVSFSDPHSAALRYAAFVATLRLSLFGAILAWEVRFASSDSQRGCCCSTAVLNAQAFTNFSTSNSVHDMSTGSLDCAKAFGPPSVALTGSFLLLPLRPAQVCAHTSENVSLQSYHFLRSCARSLAAGGAHSISVVGGCSGVSSRLLKCPWALQPEFYVV